MGLVDGVNLTKQETVSGDKVEYTVISDGNLWSIEIAILTISRGLYFGLWSNLDMNLKYNGIIVCCNVSTETGVSKSCKDLNDPWFK